MKINVNDKHSDIYSKGVGEYVREVEDSMVINAITTVSPTYYYALIDGRLFKSGTRHVWKIYRTLSIYFFIKWAKKMKN